MWLLLLDGGDGNGRRNKFDNRDANTKIQRSQNLGIVCLDMTIVYTCDTVFSCFYCIVTTVILKFLNGDISQHELFRSTWYSVIVIGNQNFLYVHLLNILIFCSNSGG